MYIRAKGADKFVNITPNNFDALSVDERGNITCVLSGKVVSLGVYPKLDDKSYPGLIEMLFQEIWENIDTTNVYILPDDDDSLGKKVSEWAFNGKESPLVKKQL